MNREEPFDIASIRYVKRVVVGTNDPRILHSEDFLQNQMKTLNRCLNDIPRGMIIGQEKNFNVVRLGEQQIILQNVIYHIGFARKPMWMGDEE